MKQILLNLMSDEDLRSHLSEYANLKNETYCLALGLLFLLRDECERRAVGIVEKAFQAGRERGVYETVELNYAYDYDADNPPLDDSTWLNQYLKKQYG